MPLFVQITFKTTSIHTSKMTYTSFPTLTRPTLNGLWSPLTCQTDNWHHGSSEHESKLNYNTFFGNKSHKCHIPFRSALTTLTRPCKRCHIKGDECKKKSYLNSGSFFIVSPLMCYILIIPIIPIKNTHTFDSIFNYKLKICIKCICNIFMSNVSCLCVTSICKGHTCVWF